jgi:hypothetical protein
MEKRSGAPAPERPGWETSKDGSTWEHDFDLTYTKVG